MNAGELRHQIEIQEAAATRNTAGESVTTWTTIATVAAAIRPASSREVMLTQATAAQTTHTITIRYRDRVSAAARVKFGSRIFTIAGVLNVDERDVELRLVCYETGGDQ